MPRERILITVKTYPTLSEGYGELVCTAGVREDGSWVRLYPVPFRLLDFDSRYRKFEWIETSLVRNTRDSRPESFRLVDPDDIAVMESVGTDDGWRERRRLLLGKCRIYDNLSLLIAEAHANTCSLAVFKPARILDFVCEPAESRDWDAGKVAAMLARKNQQDLFTDANWQEDFQLVQKLPWKFSYRFEDIHGKQSALQILDWEAGALYWNCLKDTDEQAALEKVRKKYLDEFTRTDLHFFMGTTLEHHQKKAPNPWQIIGVLPMPVLVQPSLF